MIREKVRPGVPGLVVLLGVLVVWAWALYRAIGAAAIGEKGPVVLAVVLFVLGIFVLLGLFIVHPNEAKVLQFFGKYVGSAKAPGLHWQNPFFSKTRVSLRVRNFETNRSKVNDADGNPIEIATVVVWQVVDSAEALFEVDNYENFVHVQSESALRGLASSYPYDGPEDVESLRGNASGIAEHLQREIQERLNRAGVSIIEARFSHLAYAPEIASAMLQRQQASAVVSARRLIVEGAVGMVEDALGRLATTKIISMDDERKAQMVSNLLVVLCGERGAQPVLNAGSIHQ